MTFDICMLPVEVQEHVFIYLNGVDLEACLVIWPHITMFDVVFRNALCIDGHHLWNDSFHAPENYSWYSLWEALEMGWKQLDGDLMSNYAEFNAAAQFMSPSISKHAFVALTSAFANRQHFIIAFCCAAPKLPVKRIATPSFFDCTCVSESHALAYSSSSSSTLSLLVALEKCDPFEIELRDVPGSNKRNVQLTSSYIVDARVNHSGGLDIWCLSLRSLNNSFTLVINGVMQPNLHVVAAQDLFVVADRTCGIQVLRPTADKLQHDKNSWCLLVDAPVTLLHCSESGFIYSTNSSTDVCWQPLLSNSSKDDWPNKCNIHLEDPYLPLNARLNIKTFDLISRDYDAPLLVLMNQSYPRRLTLHSTASQSKPFCNIVFNDFRGFLHVGNARLLIVGEKRLCTWNIREGETISPDNIDVAPLSTQFRDAFCNSRLLILLDENYSYLVYDVLEKSFVNLLS